MSSPVTSLPAAVSAMYQQDIAAALQKAAQLGLQIVLPPVPAAPPPGPIPGGQR